MKKNQTVFVILALGAVIFGVTYASQFLGTRKSETKIEPEVKVLYFPITHFRQWVDSQAASEGDRPSSIVATEMELGVEGHADFWFENPQDVEIEISLKDTSCKCTDVEAYLVNADYMTWRDATGKAFLAGALPATGILNCGPAVLAAEQADAALDRAPAPSVKKLVKGGGNSLAVPPGAQGAVRLFWHGKTEAAQSLNAEIIMHPEKGKSSNLKLIRPVVFVDPVHFQPRETDVGVFDVGSPPRQQTLICWSSTRSHFTIKPLADDPFIHIGDPLPMPEQDRWKMEESMKTRVVSAYYIPLTIFEQAEVAGADGKKTLRQMDLGPFRHMVGIQADCQEKPNYVAIQGNVKDPEISVIQDGRDDDRQERLTFGNFIAENGSRLTATVIAPARFPLAIDHFSKFLKADLSEGPITGNRKSWKLRVQVLPNSVSGIFPDPRNEEFRDSAVYLKMASNPPRGIRIPIVGNATFR